jgi:plastocyanin
MRRSAIALAAAVGGALLAPAAPLADEPPTPPAAALEAQSTTVVAGQPVELDSSKSQPGTGAIVGHVWDLDGNGSFETDSADKAKVEVTPKKPGPLTVRVRVVDDRGLDSDAKLDLTVAPRTKMQAAAPSASQSAPAAETHASGPGVDSHASAPGAPDPGSPAPGTTPPAGPDPSHTAPDPSAPPAAAQPPAVDQPALEPMSTTRMSAAPAFVPTEALASGRTDSVVAKAATGATVTAAASSTSVTMKNFAFNPASSSIHVGDTITWSNQDAAPHTATASDGSFNTGQINQGKSASHTFTKAGTFAYICSIHPNMHGTVVVAAAAGGSPAGSGSPTNSSTPATPAASSPSSGSNLPHTGLDIAAVVLLAALMMGAGAALRRTAQ